MDWWVQQEYMRAIDPAVTVRQTLEARGYGWERHGRHNGELLLQRTDVGLGSNNAARYNAHLQSSFTFRRLLKTLTDARSQGPFTEDSLAPRTGCRNLDKLRD